MTFRIEDQVFWFDISVYDSIHVKIFEPADDTSDEKS